MKGEFRLRKDLALCAREQPAPEAKVELSKEFDELFAAVTGYAALDERIAKTRAKKESLLMVLEHPEIPLHNNESELGPAPATTNLRHTGGSK